MFNVKWKQASTYKNEQKAWKSVQVDWTLCEKTGNKKAAWVHRDKAVSVGVGTTERNYTINRKLYYPLASRYLTSVGVQISSYNDNGSKWGHANKVTLNFKAPKKPTATFDYNEDTGLLEITCTSPADDIADRYDCQYKVYRQDVGTNTSRYKDGKKKLALNPSGNALSGTSTAGTFKLKTNIELMQLVSGSYITITVDLWTRGFMGQTQGSYVFGICPPATPAIGKIDLSNKDLLNLQKNALAAQFATGLVRVFYKNASGNATAAYKTLTPTDYTLQRLVTTWDINRAVEAAIQSGWEDVDTNMGSTSSAAATYKTTTTKVNGKTVTTQTQVNTNYADAVMGEPAVDVLTAMGFNENGHIFDRRVWYRIKAVRQSMVRYSTPYEATEFRAPKPTASKDYSGFMCLKNGEEPGTSIAGVVGWDNAAKSDEGVDNPNWAEAKWTTIVEYSDHRYGHQSNEKPSSIEIDWAYSATNHATVLADYKTRFNKGDFGTNTNASGGKISPINWKKSAPFFIYGLTPGQPYYLRTRRHMVLDDYDLYGPYTAAPAGFYPFTPRDNPRSVQVYTPDHYTYGKSLTVGWTHDAACEQTAWSIYVIPAEEDSVANYKVGVTNVSSIAKKLLASGTGTTSSYTIPASKLNAIQGKNACVYSGTKAFSVIKQLGIVVGVSTGGKEVFSAQDDKGKYTQANFLRIGRSSTCRVYVNPTLTAQPAYIYLFTNTVDVSGVASLFAKSGTTLYLPDGTHYQAAGECLWTTTVSAGSFKTASSKLTDAEKKVAQIKTYMASYGYVAKVKIPVLDTLYDGATYTVSGHTVSTNDPDLVSAEHKAAFSVKYARQAPAPSPNCYIQKAKDADNYMSLKSKAAVTGYGARDSSRTLPPAVWIVLKAPSGFKSTDRYSIYRITPDGGELIAEDVYPTRVVLDRYAPFSKTAKTRYAILTKTADGDMSWKEVSYSLKRHGMRFDWGSFEREKSVELPYDIELSDSYEKDVRVDKYLDGSVQAHFNTSVTKKSSVSTKLVRLKSPMQFELVKDLAQHPGTAFFRAHDGSAFECVVQVDGLENNFDSQVSPVKFSLTKVALSERFKPKATDIKTSAFATIPAEKTVKATLTIDAPPILLKNSKQKVIGALAEAWTVSYYITTSSTNVVFGITQIKRAKQKHPNYSGTANCFPYSRLTYKPSWWSSAGTVSPSGSNAITKTNVITGASWTRTSTARSATVNFTVDWAFGRNPTTKVYTAKSKKTATITISIPKFQG